MYPLSNHSSVRASVPSVPLWPTFGATCAILLLAARSACAQPATQPASQPEIPAYKNLALSFEKRAADLVSRMTLREKAAQVQMQVDENTRLGIPAFCWRSEGVHGGSCAGSNTVFPHAIALAATWNPALTQKVGGVTADEARAKYQPGQPYYGIAIWAPVVNLARDPRWGRVQESYGEDPFLAGRMGVAYCKGLQGDDPKYLKAVATPKHFAVHSQDTARTTGSATVSERTLRDYYFPAFRDCFTEGGAMSTMCALSAINKVPAAVNGWLLTDVLRDDWHFPGAVVTDLRGISSLQEGHQLYTNPEDSAAAVLKAGVDVICESYPCITSVIQAVQKKLLPEEILDRAVRRNLTVRMRLGLSDPPELVPFIRSRRSVVGAKEHVALALQTARDSMVLLQNNPVPPGYGFERLLPLDLRHINTLAVLGPYASVVQLGSYSGQPANTPVTPLAGIQAAVGDRVRVITADAEDEDESVKAAHEADAVVLMLGLNERIEAEGFDRKTIDLPLKQVKFFKKIVEANPVTVLVLEGGGPITLNALREKVPAILNAWYPGEQGGNALAEVLLGRTNPAGRLPFTVYASLDDIGPLNEYEIDVGRTYLYCEKPVDYVFGHGLSYTTFAYSNLHVDKPTATAGDKVAITCDIKNTGASAGDEVVQLYVHKTASPLKRPLKQLKAFTRISIPAGESRPVRLEVPVQDLAFWDVAAHKYLAEPGTYDIMLGASSEDIRLTQLINL